ncbi:MAG: hypothetical protein AB1791_15205 [Chloroflexota bacterium]
MFQMLPAVYEHGLLPPLIPLSLGENQTVHIRVWLDESADSELEQILQLLADTGLITPPRGYSDIEPPLDEERRELAQLLGTGKPLSEIVIEERGEL